MSSYLEWFLPFNKFYAFLLSPMRDKFPTHLNLVTFRNMLVYYGGKLLVPTKIQAGSQLLSPIRSCVLHIITVNGGMSGPSVRPQSQNATFRITTARPFKIFSHM
jgi:hypothetical protein